MNMGPKMVSFPKGLSYLDIFSLFGDWLPGRKNAISSWASFPAEVQLVLT